MSAARTVTSQPLVMGKRPGTGTRAWRVTFPFMVGAVVFALGGIWRGVGAVAFTGIAVVIAARIDNRSHVGAGDRISPQSGEEMFTRFRRLWLVSLAAILVGVAIAFASGGTRAGTVALACGILFVAGGAVALAIMSKNEA